MFRRTALQLTFLCAAVAGAQTVTPDGVRIGPEPETPPIVEKVPADVILVKGAEPSASDSKTPLPEQGRVTKQDIYENSYFGLTYPLPADWKESFKGPPPSDHGAYVLANILPSANFKGPIKGTIMFSAQDIFFSMADANDAKELITYRKDHLEPYYDIERQPAEVTIAGRKFVRFDYGSKVAGLHWVILATQIRCHAVQFVLSSRDSELLEKLIKDMDRMTLPEEAAPSGEKGGGDWPVCAADYARPENVLARVDPEIKDRKFNEIPVRIIIDKKGRVKHIHFISAFPDQARIITDALFQWKFKPYVRDGNAIEVETGILFGASPNRPHQTGTPSSITASKPAD
jgi:hypothetical protein